MEWQIIPGLRSQHQILFWNTFQHRFPACMLLKDSSMILMAFAIKKNHFLFFMSNYPTCFNILEFCKSWQNITHYFLKEFFKIFFNVLFLFWKSTFVTIQIRGRSSQFFLMRKKFWYFETLLNRKWYKLYIYHSKWSN